MYEQYGENDQLKLFTIDQVVALSALHHFICPQNNVEFLHPRLFNPNKPIVNNHDDFGDEQMGELIQFPEAPNFEGWAA